MIVRCRASVRHRLCNAFVAQVPWDAFRVEIVQHSDDRPGEFVAPCVKCGTFHAITRLDRDTPRDVA